MRDGAKIREDHSNKARLYLKQTCQSVRFARVSVRLIFEVAQ